MLKGNEGNAISNSQIEEIDFKARNNNYPAWPNKNYNGFQKPYPSNAGVPNNYAGGSNNNNSKGNRRSLEYSLKKIMQAQSEQNNLIVKTTENHDVAIGQLTKQVVVMKTDIHDLQERTKTIEVQLGKIDESQTLILAKFAGINLNLIL